MPGNPPATSNGSSSGGGKSSFGFLTRKIGPVPIWVIIVAAAGAWYWYYHYGPGAAKQQQPAQKAATAAGQGQVINVRVVQDDRRRTGVGDIDEDPGDHDVNPGGPVHDVDKTTRWRAA